MKKKKKKKENKEENKRERSVRHGGRPDDHGEKQ